MVQPEHEHTLNVWLADLLRKNHGIDARQEQRQAGGGWMDVEVHIGPVKIALEAEQGQSAAKKREAIGDADRKLRRRNADCAIASLLSRWHSQPGRDSRQPYALDHTEPEQSRTCY